MLPAEHMRHFPPLPHANENQPVIHVAWREGWQVPRHLSGRWDVAMEHDIATVDDGEFAWF
jgi:hypothetical protein